MSKFEGFFHFKSKYVFFFAAASNSLDCRQEYKSHYFLSVLFFQDYFLNYDWCL